MVNAMNSGFIFVLVLCAHECIYGAQLPPNFQTCKISDKGFEECLRASAEGAFPQLASGYEELDIPPLDPLLAETVIIEAQPGPISLFQKYENIRFTGLSNVKILKFKIDFESCNMYIEALLPRMEVECIYEFKGQLLVFPIDARGDYYGTLGNIQIPANITYEVFKNDDVEYIRIVATQLKLEPENLTFRLGNIIPGNEQLDKEIHKVINDDPFALYEVIRPKANVLFSNLFMDHSNKIFTQVPMHDIFKE